MAKVVTKKKSLSVTEDDVEVNVEGQNPQNPGVKENEGKVGDEQESYIPAVDEDETENRIGGAEDIHSLVEKSDTKELECSVDDMQKQSSEEGSEKQYNEDGTEKGIKEGGAEKMSNENGIENASNDDSAEMGKEDDRERVIKEDDREIGRKDILESDDMEQGNKDVKEHRSNEDRQEKGSSKDRVEKGNKEDSEKKGSEDSSNIKGDSYVEYFKSRVKGIASDILPSVLGGGATAEGNTGGDSLDENLYPTESSRLQDALLGSTKNSNVEANESSPESSPSQSSSSTGAIVSDGPAGRCLSTNSEAKVQPTWRTVETQPESSETLDDISEGRSRESGGRDTSDASTSSQTSKFGLDGAPLGAETEEQAQADPAKPASSISHGQSPCNSEIVLEGRPEPSLRQRVAAKKTDDAPDHSSSSQRGIRDTQRSLGSKSRNVSSAKGFLDDRNGKARLGDDEVKAVSASKKWEPLSNLEPESGDLSQETASHSNASSTSSNDVGDVWTEQPLDAFEVDHIGGQPVDTFDVDHKGGRTLEGNFGDNISDRDNVQGEENAPGEEPAQLLVHPAGFIIRTIAFQMSLVVHMIATGIWLLSLGFSAVMQPIKMTSAAIGYVTGFASGFISDVKGRISQSGPGLAKISSKTFRGCLGATCVIFILVLLLMVGMLMDLILINRVAQQPVRVRQTLDFDYTEPKPFAVLSLLSSAETERLINLPQERLYKFRKIPAMHKFHISAAFMLPESEYNMNLGVFQVTTEVLSTKGQVLMRSSKPCRLRFRSLPVRILRSVVFAVPLALGLTSDVQKLEVLLLDAEEKTTPTASVKIMLEPRAYSSPGSGVPDIYEATVLLESTLPWSKAILSRWKWTIYVWTGVSLFLFEVSIVLCCCSRVIVPSFGSGSDEPGGREKTVIAEVKNDGGLRESTLPERGKAAKRRVSFEDERRSTPDPP